MTASITRSIAVAATVAMVVGGVVSLPSSERVPAGRDEAMFLTSVHDIVDVTASDRETPALHRWIDANTALLIAEGDAACDWLQGRPATVAFDPTGQAEMGRMYDAYMRVASPDPLLVTVGGPQPLAASAWYYLCPALVRSRTAPASVAND